MIGTLNELGAAWWSWVGPMLWQVLLLAVVVGLIDLALSRRGWPQIRYALWLLVFVKLFIPPTFSLPSSVFSQILPARAPEAPIIGAGILPAGAADVSPLVDYAPGPSLMPTVPVEPIGTRALEGPGLSLQAWAMLLCGAVSLLLLGWLAARGRRLRRVASLHGKQALQPPWLGEVLAECAVRLRLRRVPRLVVTDRVGSAAVFGVFRPVLLLPAGACSNLSRERMGHVLLHELAHIKRGDLIVNAAQTLVHILFWFHPAVWLAGKRLRHLRELCCDATVSKLLREKTGEYRATLVDAADSMVFGKTEPGLGLLGLFESPSRLRQRLQHLERPAWKHTRLRVVVSLAAVGIMLACVVPMTRAKPAEEAVEKMQREREELVPLKEKATQVPEGMSTRTDEATAGELPPDLSKDELIDAIRAHEQAIRTLWCKGVRQILDEELSDDAYMSHPESAPFDSSPLVERIEWAFVGSPDKGMVYERRDLGYRERVEAFNGEYQTLLRRSAGTFERPVPWYQQQIKGDIIAERPHDPVSLHNLQGHTLWLEWKPLSECLEEGRAEFAGRELVDGHPTYRVDLWPEAHDWMMVKRLWLDPSRGFNIIRQEEIFPQRDGGEKVRFRTARVDLAESAPGIWFPRLVIVAGPKNYLSRYVMDEIRVNEPIDEKIFTIDFPPGTQLTDGRTGAQWSVVTGGAKTNLRELVPPPLRFEIATVTPEGEPAAGVKIRCLHPRAERGEALVDMVAESNEEGIAEFLVTQADVVRDRYFWFSVADGSYVGSSVEVSPLDNTYQARFTVYPAEKLEFRVVDEDGNPITGATLRLSPLLKGRFRLDDMVTEASDAEGIVSARFADVPMKISAVAPGYAPASAEAKRLPKEEPYEVKLSRGHKLKGRVVDLQGNPVEGVVVAVVDLVRSAQGKMLPTDETDSEGRFEFDDVAQGPCELLASFRETPPHLNIAPVEVEVGEGTEAAEVELSARPGAALRGQYVRKYGFKVDQSRSVFGAQTVNTSGAWGVRLEDDSFIISGIPAGPDIEGFIELSRVAGFYPHIEVPEELDFLRVDAGRVRFSRMPAGAHDGLVVTYLLEGRALGKITDSAGNPLAGVQVVCWPAEVTGSTDSRGGYNLSVPPNEEVRLVFQEQDSNKTIAESEPFKLGEGEVFEKDIVVAAESGEAAKEALEKIRAKDTASGKGEMRAKPVGNASADASEIQGLIVQLKKDVDQDARGGARDALVAIGSDAVNFLLGALNDPESPVRPAVASVLGEIGDRRAAQSLIEALEDKDWRLRQQAAYALGKIGDSLPVEELVEVLRDELPRVRRAAAKALGQIGHRRAVEPLIAAFREWRYDRDIVAAALGSIADGRAVEVLAEAKDEGDPSLRFSVRWALERINGESATATARKALTDENRQVRWAAARALELVGWEPADEAETVTYLIAVRDHYGLAKAGTAAVEPLIGWLKDEDDSMRQVAAIALGEIGDQRAVEPLIEALGEAQRRATERPEEETPEDWVIQHVVVALGKIGDERAVDTLVGVLQDAEGNLGYFTAEALGRIGGEKAVEPLIVAASKGKERGIRGGACIALGKIGDARAVEPLVVAMNDEDGWVKRRAVDALGEIGGSRAVEALISALRSDDKDFRERPALALGEIGDERALEALEEVAENHELRYVREAAMEALEKIRSRSSSAQSSASSTGATSGGDELDAEWEFLQDPSNAFNHYLLAAALMDDDARFEEAQTLLRSSDFSWLAQPQNLALVRAYLDANGEALAALKTGVEEGKYYQGPPFFAGQDSPLSTYLDQFRTLAFMLRGEALVLQAEGDVEAGLLDSLAGLKMAHHVMGGRILVESAVGAFMSHVGGTSCEFLLSEVNDPALCRQAIARLDELLSPDGYRVRDDVKIEPGSLNAFLAHRLTSDLQKGQEALEILNAALDLPYREFASLSRPPDMPPLVAWGSMKGAASVLYRVKAEVTAYKALAAVKAYQLEKGRFPEALDVLVPEYLSEIPVDPFIGEPLRYVRSGDAAMVYAVGFDLKDDGGKKWAGSTLKGRGDYVFQVR